jgi:hypothetical protein
MTMTCRQMLPLAAALLAVSTGAARADVLQQLQGAWAIEDSDCSNVFTQSGGKTVVQKRDDDTLPGFVVDGRSVRGAAASCDIASVKEKSDGVSLLLSCRSQISFDTMNISLKMPDNDTLVRYDNDFPAITTRFHRCKG